MKTLFLVLPILIQVVNSQNEIRLLNSEVGPTADTIGGDIRECKEADDKPVDIPPINYVFMVILAMLSGTFSGLNLGLLGLDVKNLELLTKGPFNTVEEETDAKYALAILPLRRRGNLLLCTILLGNVTVNSGLSILIADFTSGIMGLVVSTAIIVIFGEIIPQAVCSRYALIVGAHTTYLVWFFVFLTFPVSYPISAILDSALGEEVGNILSKSQMKRMFEMLESENVIKSAERKIITAALELQEKSAEQVMTKIDDVYMLEINTLLSHKTLREIYSKGFSRVPIYEKTKDNIVGVLMSRDLILINPDKQLITLKQMSSIIIKDVIAVGNKDKLEPLLGYFKDGLTHIGIVTKFLIEDEGKNQQHNWTGEPVKKVVGIVTLEDIIEEIIQDEIQDEYEIGEEKQNRQIIKEKLVLLFQDHEAEKVLKEGEIKACLDFLQKYVRPYSPKVISRDRMNVLIRSSKILELESDENPFSHNLDQFENFASENKHKVITGAQYLYNKKQSGEAEDVKPEKIQTALKNVNETTYKPQILASSKKINPVVSPGDVEIDLIQEENNSKKAYGINQSVDGDIDFGTGTERDVVAKKELEKPFLDGIHSHDIVKDIGDRNVDLLENEELDDLINPVIYIRGVPSDSFYLILTGKVMICSGNEGFFLEQGAFNFMGVEAITNDNYIPDFSAKIIGKAKLLRITRADYRKKLADIKNQTLKR